MGPVNRNRSICFIVSLVCFVAAGVVFAEQDGGRPPLPPSTEDIVARMKEDLDLSDEQASQIIPVIQNETEQMRAIMEQSRAQETDRGAVKSQIEALRKNTESQLAQYLTQDQSTQLKNRRQRPLRRESGSGGPGNEEEHEKRRRPRSDE